MKKILNIDQAAKIANKLKKQNKSIVVAGGFFDILHIGHIRFLEKARQSGNMLFVLLESDKTARKLKGKNRPINSVQIRAEILAALTCVDYIVILPEIKNNQDYDKLISSLSPMVLAVTKNDKNIEHKKRQAQKTGARVLSVVSEIDNESTSRIARIIEKEI